MSSENAFQIGRDTPPQMYNKMFNPRTLISYQIYKIDDIISYSVLGP